MENNTRKQLDLFTNKPSKEEWEKEWQNMPEFVQDDKTPYKSVKVNFRNKEDMDEFMKLINQKFTMKTLSIWHPAYDREKPSNFLFVNEEKI